MKQTINGIEYNISPKANLSWANLSGANLSGANLSGATIQAMQDSERQEAVFALGDSVCVTAFSKANGRLCFMLHDNNGLKLIICGCYINTLEAFEQRCKEKYPNDQKEAYSAQIQYLKQL